MKRCPACGITKPFDEFHSRRNGNPSSYCKVCAKAYQQAWRESDPERARNKQTRYMRKYLYGLTPEEQIDLPKECMICGSTEKLNLDHDHQTGKFRGVLCFNHNVGIGRFQDNPQLLLNAASYLLNRSNKKGL